MSENVIISIFGNQFYTASDGSDEKQVVEMVASGKLYRKNDGLYISYVDEDSPQRKNVPTVLKLDKNNMLTISKKGKYSSDLILEEGKKHMIEYQTEYGTMFVSVFTNSVSSSMNGYEGEITAKYNIDINSMVSSRHELSVKIKKAGRLNEKSGFIS